MADPIDPCFEQVNALAAIDNEIFNWMEQGAGLFQTRAERQQALDDCRAQQMPMGMPLGKQSETGLFSDVGTDQMMHRICAPIFLDTLRRTWIKCWKHGDK
jgi:hypothetical protein